MSLARSAGLPVFVSFLSALASTASLRNRGSDTNAGVPLAGRGGPRPASGVSPHAPRYFIVMPVQKTPR